MEFRDRSIITQVAFKAAVELMDDIDIIDPSGQAKFEEGFSYLQQSLFQAIDAGASEEAGQLIRANFPGTVQVSNGQTSQQQYAPQPQYANAGNVPQDPYPPQPQYQPQPQPQGLTVKGTQHGPIPDWLWAEAAEKGVTEVYDNRDKATGTRRPWFRSTTGGENAPAFWPPR